MSAPAFAQSEALRQEQEQLVLRAFRGARLSCGLDPEADRLSFAARVRVLAAAALFRGGWMTGRAAARDCQVGDASRLSPSRIADAGVSEAMIGRVVAYLRGGETPEAAPAPAPERQPQPAPDDARAAEAARLYVEEGLSVAKIAARLSPPATAPGVWKMLNRMGVKLRPKGRPPGSVVSHEERLRRAGMRAERKVAEPTPPAIKAEPEPKVCPAPLAELPSIPAPRSTGRALAPEAPVARVSMQPLRLKPLNPSIVRWTRAYAARGVRVGYLAGLFGVDEAALSEAIGGAS